MKKIGIIGSGNIGGTAAKLFANAGYEVVISNSRGPESLTSFVNTKGATISSKCTEY
jgi:8-hydroxy-5-deazaflavin:NADPH oxidoreductase